MRDSPPLPFEPHARVRIDGDPSLVGKVTSFQFRPTETEWLVTCEVSWVHNGTNQCAWIEATRLEAAT